MTFVRCAEVRDLVNTNVVAELFKERTVACLGFFGERWSSVGGRKTRIVCEREVDGCVWWAFTGRMHFIACFDLFANEDFTECGVEGW